MTVLFHNLPDPQSTDLLRWTAELVLQNSRIPIFYAWQGPWQTWAAEVLRALSDQQSLPSPTTYTDWRLWAAEFKKAVGA